jgi:prepilin-type N-terminal cleavage/methylation domain-containing protein
MIEKGDDYFMKFKKSGGSKGFSLVELLLVIVLLAILMALVTLSGSNMMASTNAQTEAKRLIRTVQSLRSAWLACYADTQTMIGVPLTPSETWTSDQITQRISMYSDRSLAEEITRYGNISVDRAETTGRISIGFAPSSNEWGVWDPDVRSNSLLKTMKDILVGQALDYELTVDPSLNDNSVFIRVR